METYTFIIALICVVLTSILCLRRKATKFKCIPGPIGVPIVGYIPFLTKRPQVKLTELSNIYGPIYSLPLGSKRILVITDFECIKDAFENEAFVGHPPDLAIDISEDSLRTKAFIGTPHKGQRRFTLRSFRDLGIGKAQMEEHLKEEILAAVARMSKFVGKTATVYDLLGGTATNNIVLLLFGRRMRHDDPIHVKLTAALRDVSQLASGLSWQIYFPWIRKGMKYFGIGNQAKLVRCVEEVKDFCRKEINEHEATLDENNLRDFVDRYLLEIRKASHIPDTAYKKEVLTDLCRLFLSAGSGSIWVILEWFFLVLASKMDIQDRIRAEINRVLGPDRFPTGRDRSHMPYTEACLCEVLRWVSITPLSVMRFTLKDTELKGYFIPKATEVLAVQRAVDHNESLWGQDVSEFKPERFLTPDGTKVVKPEHFFPFSIGKRYCPGKSLGELELFLYLTSILRKFEVRLSTGKEADFDGILAMAYLPKRQELSFHYAHNTSLNM